LALILFGDGDEKLLDGCFKMGGNLGIYLHLIQEKEQALNPERFLAGFLKEMESLNINDKRFISNLEIILK